MTVLVNLIVTLGMFYVVPVGLRLIDPDGLARAARLWPLAALPAAVCLWLPRGGAATALAGAYALAAVALAAVAVALLWRAARGGRWDGSRAPREVAAFTALLSPSVAATALVAERAGYRLFGFDLDILALTVPHFHYAGFAAALIAGLVCRAAPGRRGARGAAYSVPAGTLLVLLGYFVDDWAELLGAAVLTGGMWAAALTTWRELLPRERDRTTAALLAGSAAVLVATMLLALWWAVGEATGIVHPTLTWMAATHGLGNALGFAVCGLLAWRRRAAATSTDRDPEPALEPSGGPTGDPTTGDRSAEAGAGPAPAVARTP
ncbi:YndJ family protein [Streptomyces sp. NPDC048606]|uniref:YndJ family protein n=1 Tax=Streptomyces sp. NPDC048606 TaxID=3154726 RepID=UPI0034408E0E